MDASSTRIGTRRAWKNGRVADRRKLGTKDMVMTMSIVLVVVALIALYGGTVSFAPGARPQAGETPTVDVVDGFSHARATLGFAVTVPEGIPSDWHPNSLTISDPSATNDGVTAVGTLKAVRGGWITPGDAYVGLTEAAGEATAVLANEFGDARPATTTVTAGGAEWSVTTGVRSEAAWFRTISAATGVTTLLITGNGTPDDFRIVAEAVAAAR